MTTILHIASSSNLHNSVSREIGAATVERLTEAHPDAKVIMRDLVQTRCRTLTPPLSTQCSPTMTRRSCPVPDIGRRGHGQRHPGH